MPSKYRILFVCTGNICRSPTGEGIMRKFVADAGMAGRIHVESAGTIDYHVGELPDPRTRRAAEQRGYRLDSRARRVERADFDAFDLLLVADSDNMERMRRLATTDGHRAKLRMMLDWHPARTGRDVPDPYYSGPEGFELVLDLLEDSCRALLADVISRIETSSKSG